ncbi:sepiapterin reductase b [Betta splendens]|uniref:Sepiapterin reductase n=1 Tax=Betta splendens TaxID=158456 RepID=A0A6P7NDA8_BETSP|nr:sepiapterin reductase b [Betta splendens]XP_029017626.1 sepiapterin reductase b [Betta splendens]
MSDLFPAKLRTLGRCFCIITGASRGFGWALAHKVSHLVQPGSVLLLVARSEALLRTLKEELRSFASERELHVHCVAADLSTRDGVNATVAAAKRERALADDVDHVLLVNNAASLGDISGFVSFTDLEQVTSYLSFNVSSALALTAGLLQVFPHAPGRRRTVVNVSSVFALQPLQSWVLYCTAKAARGMMFRVLAQEEPTVKVLSYSPGPMETEMQEEIRRLTGISHRLLPCHEPADKLMKLLLDYDFRSGAHLDFFDV